MFRSICASSYRTTWVAVLSVSLLAIAGPAEAAKPSGSNSPPVISGTPSTSTMVGLSYSFQPVASDPDGDKLTFRISGKPSWATFNSATGLLSGTPATEGTFGGISIRVTDGKTAVSLPKFSITVTSAAAIYLNTAPTISGVAVTSAQVDRPYAFQPKAADADGDKLTFSIQGKPAWATFDISTGTLYGTPSAAHTGTYSDIVISVSDGSLTAALAPYSITVAPALSKTVTLKWTAPTMNTDGTPLTDLAGYTVFYGTASRQYSTSFKLQDAGASSVVLEGFSQGTWYFSVRSLNAAGVESDFAEEVVAAL